ncbi:MAG TPA: YlmC/YmxH family sporulation protein [Clostridiaceae bacterium]|nr:YlmC/YmxH family sporulation protein [Clostridiaceae bacterium]
MINANSIREREVINIRDGGKIGIVSDVEIDFEQGKITSIIIPGPGKFIGLFGKDNDIIIPWDKIRKIGADVILVDLDENEFDGSSDE